MSYSSVSHRLAVVSGAIFVVSPFLVELVWGELYLLIPLALLLALAALPGLWRARHTSSTKRVSVWGVTITLAVAFASENYEQTLPQPIPTWVNVTGPTAIFLTGVLLIVAARSDGASSRRGDHQPLGPALPAG